VTPLFGPDLLPAIGCLIPRGIVRFSSLDEYLARQALPLDGMKLRGLLLISATVAAGSALLTYQDEAAASAERPQVYCSRQRLDPAAREARFFARETVAQLAIWDYERLEARAQRILDQRLRFADGTWKLECFYQAFTPAPEASDASWKNRIAELKRWMERRPSNLTAALALAEVYSAYGWKARAQQAGKPIAAGQPDLSTERFEAALRILEDVQSAEVRDPHYWRVAHGIAVGLGWPASRLEEIHDKCAALDPEYWPIDTARACVLLAYNAGSPEEMEAFAENAAAKAGRFGDEVYARIAWEVQDLYRNLFRETDLDWARVQAGYRALLKRYPKSTDLLSQYALLACRAHDKVTARRCFAKLNGKVDLQIFGSEGHYLRHYWWANHSL